MGLYSRWSVPRGCPLQRYHLASLGVQSYPITCVGDDLLGDQVFERANSAGLNTDFIKRHEILETGVALAKLDDQGNAEYDIRLPSAWDEIELSADEMALLMNWMQSSTALWLRGRSSVEIHWRRCWKTFPASRCAISICVLRTMS